MRHSIIRLKDVAWGETVALTLLHPLVDFCSVAVLMAGGMTPGRWLAYNALAFALQLPLGLVLDLRRGWGRAGFVVGCALTVGGAVACVCGGSGGVALCAACVGNALFHLTAGTNVLDRSAGKSGPIGVFISTGALGLTAGCAMAADHLGVVLAVAVALAGGAVWSAVRWESLREKVDEVSCEAGALTASLWAVMGLFALVIWRSWAGLLSGRMASGAGLAFLLASACVTCAGKAAGGFLFSRGLVTAVSVVGSAALCAVCSPSQVGTWLALLFVAQLATGPVLSLLYARCAGRSGLAFGLNSFGLFAGSLI